MCKISNNNGLFKQLTFYFFLTLFLISITLEFLFFFNSFTYTIQSMIQKSFRLLSQLVLYFIMSCTQSFAGWHTALSCLKIKCLAGIWPYDSFGSLLHSDILERMKFSYSVSSHALSGHYVRRKLEYRIHSPQSLIHIWDINFLWVGLIFNSNFRANSWKQFR